MQRCPLVIAAVLGLLCSRSLGAADAGLPLVDAVKAQDVGAVRTALKQGADVNVASADGATALHWAAYLDDVDIADVLLRAGARA